ncbi:MAG: hypothetical protein P1U61_06040 [Legionellaceae bacterium]|nr:hypothetical protein [Legionellaceae bacterium]
MGTIYLEGEVSNDANINTQLGAWEVLRDFSHKFNDLSGTTLTSEKLGNVFYMKINAEAIKDKHDPRTILDINKIFDQLTDGSSFKHLQLIEETPEIKEIFSNAEKDEASTASSAIIDEDLDTSVALVQSSELKEKDLERLSLAKTDTESVSDTHSEQNEEDNEADTAFNPMHRQ